MFQRISHNQFIAPPLHKLEKDLIRFTHRKESLFLCRWLAPCSCMPDSQLLRITMIYCRKSVNGGGSSMLEGDVSSNKIWGGRGMLNECYDNLLESANLGLYIQVYWIFRSIHFSRVDDLFHLCHNLLSTSLSKRSVRMLQEAR